MISETQVHPFKPVFDGNSEILILGTFPSVKSRENAFYYGHPQNRFWRVLSLMFYSTVPVTIEEKKELLLSNGIALWDVLHSCKIAGSSDSSIKDAVPNDLNIILDNCDIKHIFANGKAAEKLYYRYINHEIKREITVLPSTSPANAAYTLEKLAEVWRCICNTKQ